MADSRGWGSRGSFARGVDGPGRCGTGRAEGGRYRGLKSNFPATGMRGMWAELYINDPDILSDVTEIAVKKLGYWSESRSRDDRSLSSSTCARAYTHVRTRLHVYTRRLRSVENSIDQIAREKSGLHGRLGVFARACSETVTTTMDHS